jgi:hypothetical protein
MSEEKNIPEESRKPQAASDKSNPQPTVGSQLLSSTDQKPETGNLKPVTISQPETQTETMEVHKHPHHVMHKKKWAEYFLEFLMLFLAVFLGFIAENIREQSVERHREKEYMQSMIEDLAQDTLEVNRVSLVNIAAIENLDTLMDLLKLPLSGDTAIRKKLYSFLPSSMGAELCVFTQRTLSQLKNAGGLRLVRKKEVANLISLYDSKIQYLAIIAKSLDEITTDAVRIGIEIYNLDYYRNHHDDNYELITYDPKILKKFSNSAQGEQNVFAFYEAHLQEEKELAVRLIKLIKKDYHLE